MITLTGINDAAKRRVAEVTRREMGASTPPLVPAAPSVTQTHTPANVLPFNEGRLRRMATLIQRTRGVTRAEAMLAARLWTPEERAQFEKDVLKGRKVSSRLPGPRKRSETIKAYYKRLDRQRKRAMGLCYECPEPAMKNRTRCRVCAEKRK